MASRRRKVAIDLEGWAAWAVRLLVPAIFAMGWGAYEQLQKLNTTATVISSKVELHGQQLNTVSSKLDDHAEKLAEVSTKVDAHGQQLTAIWQRLSDAPPSQRGKPQ